MADFLSLTSSLIGLVGFTLSTARLAADVRSRINLFEDLQYNSKTYGISGILLSLGILDGGGVVKRIRQHLINDDDPEQVMLFKKSFTESFTMVGVAGAIIAQIAFTGLSLDRIEQTHWTAYAAFVVSLIAGCLAVFYSCTLQLLLSGLHGPQETRDWLTKPKLMYETRPNRPRDNRDESEEFNNPKWQADRVPSINAALMLVTPSQLLNFSLGAFLIGLGIYVGFLYSQNLGEVRGKDSALAVLIVYILFTSAFLMLYGYPAGMKTLESLLIRQKMEDFELISARQGRQRTLTTRRALADGGEDVQDLPADNARDAPSISGFSKSTELVAALEVAIRTQEEHLKAQQALLELLKSQA